MDISVRARHARTPIDQEQLRRLVVAVYPLDGRDPSPARDITWAGAEWTMMLRLEPGGDIVARAGVLVRNGHDVNTAFRSGSVA
jgi:hypothetical protein